MTVDFRLRAFGGLRLWQAGVEADIGPVRRRIVLAVLVAARGAVVGTAELVDILWGDDPSPSAVNQVQRLIGQVRRLFEPGLASHAPGRWVPAVGDGYRLELDGRSCDLLAFFELAASAREAAGRGDEREAAQKFEQALEAARDQPFAGLPPSLLELPAFVAIDTARAEVAAAAADLAIVVPRARRLLSLITRYAAAAPMNEPLQARLMRLLTASGRRAEALLHFERVRERLADELGTDPGVELQAAHLDALADPDAPDPFRPAQLPQRVAGFTPRDDLAEALEAGRASGLIVLSGMGGAGKTALAVDWAYRIAADFPDGQLSLDLRGFDPGGRQLRPADALNTLLESIGIDPSSAGSEFDARAARFRSALAERRMVVLLDNARDSAQVRPLLPGSVGCLIVVTSRNRLPGLVTHEGAWPVHVGRLSRTAARDLLRRRLGKPRVAAEPAATDELIKLCAGLPLALSVAAAQTAVSPELRLADVVAAIGSAARRLDALETGERHDDVRSAFSWSYAALSPEAARLFRLLAVHPGPEVSAEAAASIGATTVRAALTELCMASMVTLVGAGRYTVHDLLHEYAAELLDETAGERDPAERRLVEHYVHGAANAYRVFGLAPPAEPDALPPGVVPPAPADLAAALDWYGRERDALTGAIDLALNRGWIRDAALLLLHLRPIRSARVESPIDAREQTLEVLGAVERLADPSLETVMLREAAMTVRSTDPQRALRYLSRSLAIAEREGDLLNQSQILRHMATQPALVGAEERQAFARRAVATARQVEHPSVLVYSLDVLAAELAASGVLAEAGECATEAFDLAEASGMSDSRVAIACRRSEIAWRLGEFGTAAEIAEWALAHAPPDDKHTAYFDGLLLTYIYHGAGDETRTRAAAELFQDVVRRYRDSYLALYGDAEMAESTAEVARILESLDTARALQ